MDFCKNILIILHQKQNVSFFVIFIDFAMLIFTLTLVKGIENGNEIGVEILPIIPYELAEKDERFLQEAAKYIGATMSKLDKCHHRVIMTLKESCYELNSETLGKLSVMLLNCQSHAEGRQIFECTDTMTLKECTIPMDPDTWNAYHLITNRAKAICSAVRQDQFRGLTEMTVNKLMQTG